MKRMFRCSATLSVALVLTPAAALAQPTTRLVDCDAGNRLQTALDAARPGDTILVRGLCVENVRVVEEAARLTLDGQDAGAIHGPSPTANAVLVAGRNITIRRFTITGGRNGVAVLRGGSALIDRNTIRESAENGINVAQHSYANIIGNTIEWHPQAGIRMLDSSYARIGFMDLADVAARGNTVRHNGIGGVVVERASGASLAGNAISENGGPGVAVGGASHADLSGNQIDGNSADGVSVTENSHVQLGQGEGILSRPNETSSPNLHYGLRCLVNSSANGDLGTLTGGTGPRRVDGSCTLRLPRAQEPD